MCSSSGIAAVQECAQPQEPLLMPVWDSLWGECIAAGLKVIISLTAPGLYIEEVLKSERKLQTHVLSGAQTEDLCTHFCTYGHNGLKHHLH